MAELFSQLNALFQNNQVLSTVAGGSVVVWLVTNIKMIWAKFIGAVTALVSFQIVNVYEDARGGGDWTLTAEQIAFNNFISGTKALWERTKNLDLSPAYADGYKVKDASKGLAYGFSVRLVLGRLVFCSRAIERNQKITVSTNLRVFFARKERFMMELESCITERVSKAQEERKERDYVAVFNGESVFGRKYKRSMDSIFTNDNEHYRLFNAIKGFQHNKDKYQKLSYPYSFSALLYGTPGCGKSSTILAIASALNMDITYINLSKTSVWQLLDRINNTARNSIVVFEDIDALTTAVASKRNKTEDSEKHVSRPPSVRMDLDGSTYAGRVLPKESERSVTGGSPVLDALSTLGDSVSLSDLLNITDGLLATDGTICIFTTNHIERLDPALLRAGRMNEIIEFSNLNQYTAARMLRANLNWCVEPEDLKDGINPAELQTAILHVALGRATREDIEEKFFK